MRLPRAGMEAFTDDLPISDNYSPNERIGGSFAPSLFSERQTSLDHLSIELGEFHREGKIKLSNK
jgi:hypothetical protein